MAVAVLVVLLAVLLVGVRMLGMAQSLCLAPGSGVTPSGAEEIIGTVRLELKSAGCKASTLTPTLPSPSPLDALA